MKDAKLLTKFKDGDNDVLWFFETASGVHTIQYGLQINTFTCCVKAAEDYGLCVRHSLECISSFD